jgi:lysozyme family protein
MSINTSSMGEIVAAIGLLIKRRGNTSDPAEKAAINDAIAELNGELQDLDQAGLLNAAKTIAAVTDTLEKVVGAARMGPFDSYLADITSLIGRLQGVQGEMHAAEALPPAQVENVQPLPAAAVTAAKPQGALQPPLTSTNYADLKAEYESYYDRCVVNAARKANIDFYTSRLLKFKHAYQDVAAEFGAMPWYFLGAIHAMECGFNFGTHLHNGDPLTARTVHVPANRPATGTPPFTWRDSARDALMLKGYNHETDWSMPRVLYLLEKYNGFGYRRLGVPSPYLWSFSNIYVKGKFVADHEFDPEAVSAQCGAAVMIKALPAQGGF